MRTLNLLPALPVHHQVTGAANEDQVCESLRRYRDREGFVREALAHLYSLVTDADKPRPDILKVPRFIPTAFPLTAAPAFAPLAAVHGSERNVGFAFKAPS